MYNSVQCPLLNISSALKEVHLQWSKISQTITGCGKELEAKMTMFSDAGRDNYVSNMGAVSSKRIG